MKNIIGQSSNTTQRKLSIAYLMALIDLDILRKANEGGRSVNYELR